MESGEFRKNSQISLIVYQHVSARFFVRWIMLLCSVGHTFIVFSVSCETKDSLMRQDSEHFLSVLKSNSFVLKWKRVVSMLSPLPLFSRGGSHFEKSQKRIGDRVHEKGAIHSS